MRADDMIKFTLCAEWNFSLSPPGIFPGSAFSFIYNNPFDYRITLSNKDMTKNAACIATYTVSPLYDPRFPGPITDSVWVPRNSSATLGPPLTYIGGTIEQYPIWHSYKPAELTTDIVEKLFRRAPNGGGGYWEIEGRITDNPALL